MDIELKQTTAAKVASAIVKGRREIGSPAMSMVLTLVVVCEPRGYPHALEASLTASREHPSRIIYVVTSASKKSGLDAEIRLGDGTPGELIVLRMHGEVADHPTSVLMPLLLPDSPVVVWWPNEAPEHPGEDAIGRLATRRITDAMGSKRPLAALERRAHNLMPGDTDLTWTRLTPWRALLAAAVDQYPSHITGASVEGARDNGPAHLMAAWLQCRLGVDVALTSSRGPGITAVRLHTPAGDIAVTRGDGLLANYMVPGQPQRSVALRRRDINTLLTEELRRMDYDDIFEEAAQMIITRREREEARRAAKKTTAKKSTAKKTTAKKTTAKKTAAKRTATKKTAAKKAAATKAAEQIARNTPSPSAARSEAVDAQAAVPMSPLDAGLVADE